MRAKSRRMGTLWAEDEIEAPKAGDDSKKLTVESVDNHVYFYSYVDADRILAMMKTIREIDTRLRTERLSRDIPDGAALTPIWLHVQSYGGGLTEAWSAADQLARIHSPVYSIAEGVCASAASIISCACTKRFILPTSFMLIHQFRSMMWGTYEQFEDDMVFQDMAIERLRNFYVARTSMDYEKVTELLKHDSWFSAEQCVELGLADEILI